MKPIVAATLMAATCCLGLNGCVLAVVGAAGAGGYLAANSHTLTEDGAPPPQAHQAPPDRPPPPAAPQALEPPPPPAPAYQSAPIQAVPLN